MVYVKPTEFFSCPHITEADSSVDDVYPVLTVEYGDGKKLLFCYQCTGAIKSAVLSTIIQESVKSILEPLLKREIQASFRR